ncbi:trehalose-phosphatase [Nocardioides mangrovicus]|uniref:Trehalose 6-phosphate phosphatase n=1 Tax=Nocardioides mangrovicus TaxID=2478913 RepID=A0A3L8NYV6_9ACTN|nr:trehalose-phosphatase [Nocardioides mangrovicus]RLV48345.1 trehalose-phosphatase [Nocardioides mangrovicus]
METVSPDAERHYAAVVRGADRLVVGLDFDGTLAPIVEDPEQARIHPRGREVLLRLAEAVRGVAVVTGRPARQVLALGGLDEIGDELGGRGRDLYVLGQYGNERWSSHERRVITPKPPRGLATLSSELPGILRRADAAEAWVEEKGLALGIHTRRLPDPDAALERLREPVGEAARRHDLVVEPGRMVLEVRAGGMDKGAAVHRLAEELDAGAFCFVGDDLGDVEAFKAVGDLRADGVVGLLVASGSREESALVDLADVVVAGPDGVMDFLDALVDDVRALRA